MFSRATIWTIAAFLALVMILPSVHAAGDVFIIRSIDIPSFQKGSPVDALITVENLKFGQVVYNLANTATLQFTIRDKSGVTVSGFSPTTATINFGMSSNPEIVVYTLNLDPPYNFTVGETFTLNVRVVPFVDGGNPTLNESVSGNNSGKKTFSVIAAPQTFQVPDMPFEMVLLSVLLVTGWLYAAQGKK
jgi:hypothetical protein